MDIYVYAHTNSKVKRVLDTNSNIMTSIVNWLLIPNNINPNPILVIRSYVNVDRAAQGHL